MYPVIYRASRLLWHGGGETRRHLRDLRASQWFSKTELEALQLRKIQHLVRHAYENVPFYHERYQQAGICPDDIRTLADFERLPFVTREDVNQNREAMVARNVAQSELFANETGGSTGEPMRFFQEDSFWWQNAANWFRAREWYGVHEGDKTAWFWGAQQDMPSWNWRRRLRSALMQERYLNAFNMTQPAMHDFATMLQEWRPLMFKGYASTLSLFARYVQEAGITGIRPRFIESTSEKLFTPQRELLESVFGCPVADHYSSREMGTIAYQCPHGGLHICADVRYLEIVANGQVAPAGTLGEVVLTAFNQFAMPFIRYKNGDMGLTRTGDCTCGRTLPLLQEIVGRTNDYLVAADGRFVHSEFFAYTFRVKPEVARYQVYQPDPAHLEVHIVCNQTVTDNWLEGVQAEIQTRFGPGTSVSLQVVDQIALTPAGKHRYIVSDVRPDFA
ncbi:MAG: phenylacetate--CoA ligase family protein [Anaerolineae bacterium]|nr:phenylacetate--CoA ligase family protein [Anaerolineae bacterium]